MLVDILQALGASAIICGVVYLYYHWSNRKIRQAQREGEQLVNDLIEACKPIKDGLICPVCNGVIGEKHPYDSQVCLQKWGEKHG